MKTFAVFLCHSTPRNRSENFSGEPLMDFLTALGHDVGIRVKRAHKPHGQMSVVEAA